MKHTQQNLSLNINIPKDMSGLNKLHSFKIDLIDIDLVEAKDLSQISPVITATLDKDSRTTDEGKIRNSGRIEFKSVRLMAHPPSNEYFF